MRPIDEPVADGNEINYLKLCARIGASARDKAIGNAVVNRCLFLANRPARQLGITDLLEVMVEACAAHAELADYRKQVGESFAGACFAASTGADLKNILVICETLGARDEKLMSSLAKARSIAETRSAAFRHRAFGR
jgi:hypothetical protein